MIFEFFLSAVVTVIIAVFGVLPSLPAMPEWITDYTDEIVNIITTPLEMLAYFLSPTILIFVLTTSLVVLNFEIVYHAVLWILRKLPFGIN